MSDAPRRRIPSSVQRPPKVPKPPELTLDRARTTAKRILGEEGRLIAGIRSHYSEKRPTNLPVFQSSVAMLIENRFESIWCGDLDMTLWEQRLAALARQLDHEVCLFYEGDALCRDLSDPRSNAIVIVSARGETEIGLSEKAHIFRAHDGTLRRHIPPAPKRFEWRVLLHRPALLHFWRMSIRHRRRLGFKTWIAYLGRRNDDFTTPLFVFVYTREKRARARGRSFEWTWYPASRRLYAPKPLIEFYPRLDVRSFSWWAHLVIWPGCSYSGRGGYQRRH